MNTAFRAIFIAAFWALTLVATASADGLYSRNEFKQRWIGYHEELTPEHLNKLFGYLETDAKTAKMLGDLRRATGKQSAFELMSVISLCVDNKDDFALQMRGPDIFGETDVSSLENRAMCLSRGISVGDAVATLVHEMTHFLYVGDVCSKDPKRYASVDAFSLGAIMDPGAEVDAFMNEYQARIHIEHSRMGISYLHREFFTDSGQFLGTRREFAELLLSIPAYKQNFAERYELCKSRLAKK